MQSRRAAAAAPLALAAIAMTLAAAPTDATVRERFSITEPIAWSYECGFPVEVTGSRSDHFTIREGRNRDAGAFPVLHRGRFHETHTNTDTGEWFTIEGRSTFNEVEATRVEGTIFEFHFVDAGQPYVVRDSDGDVVSRNRGSQHVWYLFDTLGDDEPGGEFVADVGDRVNGPHPDLERTICDIAIPLIG